MTITAVVALIGIAAIAYHLFENEQSASKCILFAVKAITTSGVPDQLKPGFERFLIGFLPFAVLVWASMIDALISRRPRQTSP